MSLEFVKSRPSFLTEGQRVLISLVRDRMKEIHRVDTHQLQESEIPKSIAAGHEIVGDEDSIPAWDLFRGGIPRSL